MSDSDTTDSDSGIRFKTTSTRFKAENSPKSSSSRHSRDDDRRRRSDSRRSDRKSRGSAPGRSKSRSRSRDHRKRNDRDNKRHRSRSRSKSERSPPNRSSYSKSNRQSSPRSKTCSSSTSNNTTETVRSTSAERPKIEPTKTLDVSASSISSQDDQTTKDVENCFGPALPPVLQSRPIETSRNSNEEDTDVIGPALPPQLPKEYPEPSSDNNSRVIGPALPTNFIPYTDVGGSSESELSPFSEEEPANDEDVIGPMPGTSSSRSHLELEQRALELKLKRFDGDGYDPKGAGVTSREDWMLELPDVRKVSDMGLGARQFRTREKLEIGDRSVWTDTPSDRERKKAGQSSKETKVKDDKAIEQEQRRTAERDKHQEELVKRHKKKHKRDKSLLEIHQKKVKKDKKEKDGSLGRRPFDRNVDLHANQFDEAQKKAIFKKAQLLDTRFSSGASKFL